MNKETFNNSNTVFFLSEISPLGISTKSKRRYYTLHLEIGGVLPARFDTRNYDHVCDIAFNYNMMIVQRLDESTNELVTDYYRLEHVINWSTKPEVK